MRSAFLFIVLLISTLSNGQVVFDKTYGGITYNRFGRNVELANNNGYLINASLGTPYMNTILYRLNAIGDTLWTRHFGTDSIQFKTYEMTRISNGGYLMCGDYQHVNDPFSMDSYLMEIDSLGQIVWFNEYGRPNGKDYANNVIELNNGNVITTGEARYIYPLSGPVQSFGVFQGYISMFDLNGDSLRSISLSEYYQQWNLMMHPTDIAVTNDKICVVGRRYTYAQMSLVDTSFVLILDEGLDTVATIILPVNKNIYSVDATPAGTFVIFGDDLLAEIDTNGNFLWQQQIIWNQFQYTKVAVRQNGEIVLLQSGNGGDIAYDVQSSNCSSIGPIIIHTLNNVGNEISADTISMVPSSAKGLIDFVLEGDSLITLTGGNGPLQVWVLQYNGRGHEFTDVQSNSTSATCTVYPVPCNDFLAVYDISRNSTFTILNSLGQEISLPMTFDDGRVQISTTILEPGYYLLRIIDESGMLVTTSFIKQ